MTEPAAGSPLEADLWCVVHVQRGAPDRLRNLEELAFLGVPLELTGPFFRWHLAVEWAAAAFPDDRQAEVLPFALLRPEFEDEAAALGEVEPTAWVLCRRDDQARALVAAVGPFVNRHIALADFAIHPERYAEHLAAIAAFGMLEDTRLTGEDLPPAEPPA
jgi:hypothetical protein